MSGRHKREAYAALLQHYVKVFRHYWQNRKELGSGLFTEDEADFLPAALSLQEKPVSPTSRLTAKILMVLVVALFIWSFFDLFHEFGIIFCVRFIPTTYTKPKLGHKCT